MRLNDVRTIRPPWYGQWIAPLLNDPRDVVFVGLVGRCTGFAAFGTGLFFVGTWIWALAPLYWCALVFVLLDRFTLMLHCTSHRPLFKPAYAFGNSFILWVLGPFFGQTPHTYFAHHLGMHHVEENLASDLSSTMVYQRDRLSHWLRYYFQFLFLGIVDLTRYLTRRGRARLRRKVFLGEGTYFTALLALAWENWEATLVVFAVPAVLIRTLMMVGNWAQHAFISRERPDQPHLSSITCINSRYNRRCFNDGYHIGHHVVARAHWTEYPAEFEENLEEYGRKDAIVFDGLDFFQVWAFLMTGRWSRLARAFVRLPEAPERDEAAVIRLLKERVLAFEPPRPPAVP